MPLEEEIARTKKRLADLEKQKAMDKDDSDIEVIEAEPNYHGINISWRPLQKFLVQASTHQKPGCSIQAISSLCQLLEHTWLYLPKVERKDLRQ